MRLARLLPGLGLTGAIACVALRLAPSGWLQAHGIGALTVALLLGMGVGHAIPARHASAADEGAAFSRVRLLRLGIVLYGLRLTFQDIAGVGWAGIAIDVAVLCSTFGLACCLGTRVFGLDRRTTLLIGAGSSICGAAAVMATAPVVRGRAGQVTVAVATVVVFGTLAIFLYPVLYRLDAQYRFVGLSPAGYGMFAGSTIHEVAQVVAAGRAGGAQAADAAVVAKMVRVIMLAPFLMLLSAWLARHPEHRRDGAPDAADDPPGRAGGIAVPWFALGFVAVAGLHSTVRLPAALVDAVHGVDTVLLAMAMGGLGLGTRVSALRTAGIRPLALAAVLFGWLVCGGLAINRGLAGLLG